MQILGRLFNAFPRVVQFPGTVQTAPEEFDIGAPIQPVWDVHRDAELSKLEIDRQAGGFFQIGQDNGHGGAGVLTATVSVYANPPLPAAVLATNPWVWLIEAWFTNNTSIASITEMTLSMGIAALGNAFAARDVGLMRTPQASFFTFHNPAGTAFVVMSANVLARPIMIPFGGSLGFRSEATAACTCRLNTICWVGPVGVYPPGLA